MRRVTTIVPMLLLSLAACAGPKAAPPPAAAPTVDPVDAAMGRAVGKAVSEENLDLIFSILRRSLTAASEGKPVPELTTEERAKLEEASKRMQKDALEASIKVLDQVEKEMREAIRSDGLGK